MEFRLFIPDTPRRALSAVRYYIGARKNPVKIYGIEDMRRTHRAHMATLGELRRTKDKMAVMQEKLIEAQKELTRLKRGVGSGRVQSGIANPVSSGSTPAHASKTPRPNGDS